MGNVRVRFRDGHAETWTSLGRCLLPNVSRTGLVGWSWFSVRNDYGEPVNSTVRIRFLSGRVKDFHAHMRPFIEDWVFADNDRALVICSMGRHGASFYIKYSLATGEVLASVDTDIPDRELPAWALPVSGYQPEAQPAR